MTIRDYGKCPVCGELGKTRERRMHGNDRCVAFHTYASAESLCSCSADTVGYCGSVLCVNADPNRRRNYAYLYPQKTHLFCPDCDGAGEYVRLTGNQVQPCEGICGGKSGPISQKTIATVCEYIKVLESRLAYYEDREDDARYCAEYTLAVSTKHDHPAYAVARRYLSGDYPKK